MSTMPDAVTILELGMRLVPANCIPMSDFAGEYQDRRPKRIVLQLTAHDSPLRTHDKQEPLEM